jgi:hypothetical protein
MGNTQCDISGSDKRKVISIVRTPFSVSSCSPKTAIVKHASKAFFKLLQPSDRYISSHAFLKLPITSRGDRYCNSICRGVRHSSPFWSSTHFWNSCTRRPAFQSSELSRLWKSVFFPSPSPNPLTLIYVLTILATDGQYCTNSICCGNINCMPADAQCCTNGQYCLSGGTCILQSGIMRCQHADGSFDDSGSETPVATTVAPGVATVTAKPSSGGEQLKAGFGGVMAIGLGAALLL